jgi:hypothetical protein
MACARQSVIYYWIVYSVFVAILFPLYALLHIISKKNRQHHIYQLYTEYCVYAKSLYLFMQPFVVLY